MSRDLRNLASPVLERPEAIDRNLAQDLIFQSEGKDVVAGSLNARNTQRVRFCLAPDGLLYRNIQTWTTAAIPNAPSSTRLSRHRLDQDERRGGERRERHAADLRLQRHRAAGHHGGERDAVRRREPREAARGDGAPEPVYLRNQNRKPTALFSVEVVNNSIVLNASESTDPEEKALIYTWKIDDVGPADRRRDRDPADEAGDRRKPHRAGSISPTGCSPTTRPTPSACPRRHWE